MLIKSDRLRVLLVDGKFVHGISVYGISQQSLTYPFPSAFGGNEEHFDSASRSACGT